LQLYPTGGGCQKLFADSFKPCNARPSGVSFCRNHQMKPKSLVFAGVLFLANAIQAQTNIQPTLTTNLITAAADFREVNGKLYNTSRSILFHNLSGNCLNVLNETLLIQTFTLEPIEQAVVEQHPSQGLYGFTGRYHSETTMVQTGTKETPGPTIVLINYPINLEPAVGMKLNFRAIQTGVTNYDGQQLELWNYGTPHIVAVIKTNFPSRAFQQKL
jgi:hypothetical protein